MSYHLCGPIISISWARAKCEPDRNLTLRKVHVKLVATALRTWAGLPRFLFPSSSFGSPRDCDRVLHDRGCAGEVPYTC